MQTTLTNDFLKEVQSHREKQFQEMVLVSDQILSKFKTAFVTGSYAYSEHIDRCNDIDIVLCLYNESETNFKESIISKIQELGENLDIIEGDYFDSLKIKTKGNVFYVNIILVLPIEWHCWLHATKMMKLLPNIPNDKIQRHSIFESLRATVKSTLRGYHTHIISVDHAMSGVNWAKSKKHE